jgi:predicted dehydrogenase
MAVQLRVGVIGASGNSDLRHLPALKSHPRAEVVAICDIDRDLAKAMAAKYDIPFVCTDYREVIDKGRLDALLVVTPDDTHHPITMEALDAGLHVLCERPLAHNTRQAREMYETARAANVKHMTFFSFRLSPHYRYLKELIDGGYVGRCFDCHMCLFTGQGRSGQYSWRYDRKHGSGVLGEYGSDMIDLARWLSGDIAKVSAHLRMFVRRPGSDRDMLETTNDSATLAIESAKGTQGVMQLSCLAHIGARGMDQRITLHGESGTLEARATYNSAEIRGLPAGEDEFRPLPIPDRLLEGVDRENPYHLTSQFGGDYRFVDAILEDRPLSPSFYDGFKAQQVIDAAKVAYLKGSWILV